MSVNDEFDFDEVPDLPLKAAPKKKGKPDLIVTAVPDIDSGPETVRIIIDEVAGWKSNYEVVGVNGVVYQIRRGIPVEVPIAVVRVLENCITTHIEQRVNKITGEVEDHERSMSSIPWRRA